jgi:methylated-DNA-protein-cysteine methyltransferase-like protein
VRRPGRPAPGRFDEAVWDVVRRIPRGRVVTYGRVAALLGAPRAARAVGQAMRRCPDGVPWHRVINGQGAISRRPNPDGMVTQRLLLRREGVRVSRGHVDLARFEWARARVRILIDELPTASPRLERA